MLPTAPGSARRHQCEHCGDGRRRRRIAPAQGIGAGRLHHHRVHGIVEVRVHGVEAGPLALAHRAVLGIGVPRPVIAEQREAARQGEDAAIQLAVVLDEILPNSLVQILWNETWNWIAD